MEEVISKSLDAIKRAVELNKMASLSDGSVDYDKRLAVRRAVREGMDDAHVAEAHGVSPDFVREMGYDVKKVIEENAETLVSCVPMAGQVIFDILASYKDRKDSASYTKLCAQLAVKLLGSVGILDSEVKSVQINQFIQNNTVNDVQLQLSCFFDRFESLRSVVKDLYGKDMEKKSLSDVIDVR